MGNEGCISQDRGICETSQKLCCLYAEVQFPPSMDIGCGCCGIACCRDKYEGGAEPILEAGNEERDCWPEDRRVEVKLVAQSCSSLLFGHLRRPALASKR